MSQQYYVYLLTTRNGGPLYCGVTNDLVRRVWEHREGFVAGYTRKYNVKKLVWYEVHSSPIEAITREKQIKKWNRAWKVEMIDRFNPVWKDLFDDIV